MAGLALFQSGRCGANVQHKYLGLLLPGPGRSSTTLPASKQAASPSILYPLSCIPPYQDALKKSGYDHILEYEPPELQRLKKRTRKRGHCGMADIVYEAAVKEKVRDEFKIEVGS